MGENNKQYAGVLSNLALIFARLGDSTKSKLFHEKALNTLEKLVGWGNPEYATALSNLGLSMDFGNYVEAERCFVRSVDMLFNHMEKNFSYGRVRKIEVVGK